jgi:hypothetical protein
MRQIERVTVTLPAELLLEIEKSDKNRSRFVAEAVRRELERRRREELQRSLENPHSEGLEMAQEGFHDWVQTLPQEDSAALLDMRAGRPVRWVAGEGWVEEPV